MKNGFKFAAILASVVALAIGAVAFAGTAGGIAPIVGKTPVSLTVPKKASSACVDLQKGRATSTTVDVSGTTMMNWTAKDTVTIASPGTDAIVKRSFDSNSAYIPSSGEKNLPIEARISAVKFARYSGSSVVTICSELN